MSQPFLYGKLTDTYTTATLPRSLVVGQQFVDFNTGKFYQLMKAGASIAVGDALKFDPAIADQAEVIPTAAATDGFHAVHCVTGAAVADQTIFWAQIRGPITVKVAASQSSGVILAPSGTAGTLTVASAAAVQQIRAVLTADSGAGGVTAAYLY